MAYHLSQCHRSFSTYTNINLKMLKNYFDENKYTYDINEQYIAQLCIKL